MSILEIKRELKENIVFVCASNYEFSFQCEGEKFNAVVKTGVEKNMILVIKDSSGINLVKSESIWAELSNKTKGAEKKGFDYMSTFMVTLSSRSSKTIKGNIDLKEMESQLAKENMLKQYIYAFISFCDDSKETIFKLEQ